MLTHTYTHTTHTHTLHTHTHTHITEAIYFGAHVLDIEWARDLV